MTKLYAVTMYTTCTVAYLLTCLAALLAFCASRLGAVLTAGDKSWEPKLGMVLGKHKTLYSREHCGGLILTELHLFADLGVVSSWRPNAEGTANEDKFFKVYSKYYNICKL